MGDIKDIFTAFRDMYGEVSSIGAFRPKNSITKMASDGICNFPVLVSDSCSIDDALTIAKALEKRYASVMLTAFTMNPYMDVSGQSSPSASDYVHQFHQNMNTGTSARDGLAVANDFINEAYDISGADYEACISEGFDLAYSVFTEATDRNINIQNTRFNFTVEEVTNPSILNDRNKVRPSMEAKVLRTLTSPNNSENITKLGTGTKELTNGSTVAPNTTHGGNGTKSSTNVNQVNPHITVSGNGGNGGGPRVIAPMNHTVDADFKKANDLVPTLLHVRVFPKDKDSNQPLQPIDFIIGIKATLHPIPSNEMILNVSRGIRNEDNFFNFVRWTTGELKFFKDFLFGIDNLKIDAINNSKGGSSGWFTALRRRKNLSRVANAISKKNILPNATIVMTTDDMEMMKDQFGFDLTKPNTKLIKIIMDKQFLLGFVRVNTALQRADFLFDNETSYESHTFSSLNKENTMDDRKFKDMMKMIGR